MLTPEEILKYNDIKIERVDVPEWGGHVYVKQLEACELDAWELSGQDIIAGEVKTDLNNIRARLVAFTLCDESGILQFNESQINDLGKKSAKAIKRISDRSQTLNGIGVTEIEAIEKNSEIGQKEDSISS